ncbi:hypothetical protein Q9233_004918 [Columba guinea]|nr:hypothetical protein Q9233_004918 [Columba guinea]
MSNDQSTVSSGRQSDRMGISEARTVERKVDRKIIARRNSRRGGMMIKLNFCFIFCRGWWAFLLLQLHMLQALAQAMREILDKPEKDNSRQFDLTLGVKGFFNRNCLVYVVMLLISLLFMETGFFHPPKESKRKNLMAPEDYMHNNKVLTVTSAIQLDYDDRSPGERVVLVNDRGMLTGDWAEIEQQLIVMQLTVAIALVTSTECWELNQAHCPGRQKVKSLYRAEEDERMGFTWEIFGNVVYLHQYENGEDSPKGDNSESCLKAFHKHRQNMLVQNQQFSARVRHVQHLVSDIDGIVSPTMLDF